MKPAGEARRIWLGLGLALPLLLAWLAVAHLPAEGLPMAPAALGQLLAVLAAFAGAFAADAAIRRYVWYGRLAEDGRPRVPAILIGLASVAGYALVALLVAALVLGLDVSAAVATSGVLAIVLGVSAQQTLGQVFAGLALSLSRPFRIGDSLQVDGVWGRVVQADWRAVTLQTYEGTVVTLPNTLVAAARLTNLRAPSDVLRHAIPFVVEPEASPARVQAVALAAMAGMECVMSSPAPLVLVKGFEERGVVFEALFWHRDPNLYILRRDQVAQALWHAFQRTGVPLAAHRRLLGRPEALPPPTVPQGRLAVLLHATRLFAGVPEAELDALAGRARLLGYAAGERIMAEGTDGASMFLLLDGEVSVRLASPDGTETEIYTQRAGEVFGHMSALTGAPRFATVRAQGPVTLAEFDKASLTPLINAHPDVVEAVAREILRIAAANQALRQATPMLAPTPAESDPLRALQRLASRIRGFFQG